MTFSILKLYEIFEKETPIIGVDHLEPLPGSPLYKGDFSSVIERAIKDASTLEDGGVDGIIIENFGDIPYWPRVTEPETIAAMAIIVREVSREVSIPIGVSFLRNSAVEALAIAHVCGAKFIRVNAYVENVSTDSGIIEAAAPAVIRYAKKLGAKIGVLADVHVKHASPLGERHLKDVISDAFGRGLATAVILTGSKTGEPPSKKDLLLAKGLRKGPILIGSGLSLETIELLKYADGAIVGTFFKKEGNVHNPVDVNRVKKFINAAKEYLRKH